MADDYYKTLGVSKTASADEIRKAYRKLARVNHPDAKPNDSKAAEKFKQIQEAYDVLNDAEKRKLYDQFGPDFQQMSSGGPRGQRGPGGFGGTSGPIDISELFGNGGIDLGDSSAQRWEEDRRLPALDGENAGQPEETTFGQRCRFLSKWELLVGRSTSDLIVAAVSKRLRSRFPQE